MDKLKIQVNETGIYQVTYDNLSGAGVDVAAINPQTFRLYNKGSEIPIYVYGEGDAAFDSGDYIEFYGEKENTRYSYSNAYWLTFGQSAGLRMENKTSYPGTTPESFLYTNHYELNQYYWSEIPAADDPWYFYPPVTANTSQNFTVYLDDLANTSENAEFLARLQGFNTYNYTNMTYRGLIYLNNHLVDNITWQGNGTANASVEMPSYWLSEGNNTIRVEHILNSSYPNAWILVDWFNISYRRKFQAKDDYLRLSASGVGNYTYSITNFSQEDIRVYDISDHDNVKRIANATVESEGTTYKVTFNDNSSAAADYAVVSPAGLKTYQSIIASQSCDLRNTTNQAGYIILTYDGFYNATLPLAEHRQAQGLSVKVVNLSDVYDEFNYGIASPDAIKYFLNYTYTNWQDPAPTYVLLVGDGTYDYRDDEGYGFTNYMPAHLVFNEHFGETASDDWFVCFDSESDIFPDMLIGR